MRQLQASCAQRLGPGGDLLWVLPEEAHVGPFSGMRDGSWAVGDAVTHGLSLGQATYHLERPGYVADARLVGPGHIHGHLACELSPWPATRLRALLESPKGANGEGGGRCHLEGFRVNGWGLVDRGVHAYRLSRSTFSNLEATGCLEAGFHLEQCQSVLRCGGLLAHACATGILAQECNALQASSWRAAHCQTGVSIQGGWTGPPPWPFAGGMTVNGIVAEFCDWGVVVRNCLKAVTLGGHVWIEAISGGAGLLIDNATVVADAISVSTAEHTPALILRNGSTLVVKDLMVGTPLSGILMDDTSRIVNVATGRTDRGIQRGKLRTPRSYPGAPPVRRLR